MEPIPWPPPHPTLSCARSRLLLTCEGPELDWQRLLPPDFDTGPGEELEALLPALLRHVCPLPLPALLTPPSLFTRKNPNPNPNTSFPKPLNCQAQTRYHSPCQYGQLGPAPVKFRVTK